MDWNDFLKRAMTIICSLTAAAVLLSFSAFARDTSSPGTSDQTDGGRSGSVIGETDTSTTGSRDERRRERPPDVRKDDKSSGNSSLLKSRLGQTGTSVEGTGSNSSLKLKLQQPKPRVGPGPK